MREFKNKIAVVTGAASGIGKALAERCLNEDMKVVMADIEEDALLKTADEFQSRGKGDLLAVNTDVSKKDAVEALAKVTLDTFGAVHMLFNNAGIATGNSVWESTYDDWEWAIGVNLWSVIHGVKAFLPIMLEQDCDCYIANTASVAGLIPGGGISTYSVTKHAVVALTESLYFSLLNRNSKVKVSVICPGFVDTNILDAERNRPENLQDRFEIEQTPEMEAGMQMIREVVKNSMPPDQLAEIVFKSIGEERLYVHTHPDYDEIIRNRFNSILEGKNPEAFSL